MIMEKELKVGDVIYIESFKEISNERNKYWCDVWFKKLIGLPTKVITTNLDVDYVSHPTLDLVPLHDECINYRKLGSINIGGHDRIKKKQKTLQSWNPSNVNPELVIKSFKLNESEDNKKNMWLDLIEQFNNGSSYDFEKIERHFKSISNFIKIIDKLGLINHIEPFGVDSDYQNQVFYAFYQNDTSFVWKIVDKYLSDVTKIGDDYYYDTTADDLAGFFDTSYRSEISRNGIESILSGEYDMNFWDVTDDVYRDVYDELTPENKKLVNERIVEELKNIKTIDTHTELLEEIAEEQGREDVELTDEVISRILQDDDTIEYLINKELGDVRSDLYNIYASCYEGTLTDEWHDSLMSELVGFVIDDDKRDEYSYKREILDKEGNRVNRTFYGTRYKATNCIYDVVSEWLEENKDCEGGYCDTIEYFGSYDRLLADLIDDGTRKSLRVPRLDEYADHRKVESCVNGGIRDYF